MTGTQLLHCEAVSAGYGARRVLFDVSLSVQAGETVALVGANGAGKTTLMRTLMGLLPTSAGVLSLAGVPLATRPTHWRVRRGMALSPEGRLVCADMSVTDNLLLGAYAVRAGWAERRRRLSDMFALFAPLAARRHVAAGLLSGGEQQMLSMGRALMANPQVLLLDEPTLGLSPRMTEAVFQSFAALRARGVALLLAEQQASLALQAADRGYVLAGGRIVREGTGMALRQDAQVRSAFLGGL